MQQHLAPALVIHHREYFANGKGTAMTQGRDARDRSILWLVTIGSAVVIAIVLYFAGAFTRSTG